MSLGLLKREFHSLQDRCRATILGHLSHKEPIDVRGQQKVPSSSRKNLGHLGDSGSSQEEPAPPQTSRKRKSLRNLFKKSTPLFNKSQSD